MAVDKSFPRIAITYQHSLEFGGSERVLEVLAEMYPSADFFCMVVDPSAIPPALRGRSITASFLDRIPLAKKLYPFFQVLAPTAAEAMDLSAYDLVISSDGSHTMGVITRQDAPHICYCHSPHRSLWDQYHTYCRSLRGPVRWAFIFLSNYLRTCNYLAAQRVTCFVANSHFVSQRIAKYYGRQSTVIYPPVRAADGFISDRVSDYYLSVGRLIPTKRVDLLIEACNRLERRLLICGTGREETRLKAIAGPTIEFLGRVPDAQLPRLYAECRAFLFAAVEDFGIAPVEAQSYGRPVIAYGLGGSLETVRVGDRAAGPDTGVLFPEQTGRALVDAIQAFEANESGFIPSEIRRHALMFDSSVFRASFDALVTSSLGKRGEDGFCGSR
jgi:glycosyltransferase involved in cell wall biosynthesis